MAGGGLGTLQELLSGVTQFVGIVRTVPASTELTLAMLLSFAISQMPELYLLAMLVRVSPEATV